MSPFVETIAPFVAILLLLLGLPALRSYGVQLTRRAELRDKFFEAAHRVLDDPNLPDAIFSRVAFLTQTIDSRVPTRLLLLDALNGKFKRAGDLGHEHALLQSLSPRTRAEFESATLHYFRAVSFNNPIAGKLFRQVLGSSLKRNAERADRTALLLREQMHDAQVDADRKLAKLLEAA